MAFFRRVLGISLLVCIAFALCRGAGAAAERPNALDLSVDAISTAALMHSPATRLTDAPRQAAADRLVDYQVPGWILSALFEALALAYFWLSGGAAAWRDRLRRSLRSVGALRFWFGATLGLIARAAAFPTSFYLYRVEHVMGLSPMLTRTWGALWVLHTLTAMILAGIVAAFVLWLVDRTHQWYLYAIAAILVASIGWSNLAPYFLLQSVGLVPVRGALAVHLHDLMDRAGYPNVPVYVQAGEGSPLDDAVVQGMGTSRRVLLPSGLVRASGIDELGYDVAFQLGDVAQRAALWTALVEAAIVIVGAALAVVIADRVGFRRDDDPLARLALVGALLAIVYLFGIPVRNATLRALDMRDDAYAVALTHDPPAAVRALVRATDQRMDEDCPTIVARWLVDTRPAPGIRIALINGVPSACP